MIIVYLISNILKFIQDKLMKLIITIIFSFIFLNTSYSQEYFNKKENQNKKHLIIVHPSLSNMERYDFLIKNGILDPKNLTIVGVYFKDENNDYQEVIDKFPDYGFHEIPSGLDYEKIYTENSITEEFKKIFNYSSGIIFNGGPDIPPSAYSEEMLNLTSVTDPWRHYYELSFLFHLLGGSQDPEFKPFLKKRPKYLILGICLGLQSMNVAAGGTLIQDIPFEIYEKNTAEEILNMDKNSRHRNYYSKFRIYPEINSYYPHQLHLIPGRWLSTINTGLYSNPYVLSSHHQSIEKLGAGYRITATSMDKKIIEGIEHICYPNVVGIQFHPEIDYLFKDGGNIKFKPSDESFSLHKRIKDLNSYEFHLRFWTKVMDLL